MMTNCTEECTICKIPQQPKGGWQKALDSEFEKDYFKRILEKLHPIAFFPPTSKVLRCFTFFDINETKVVILGQDPYHGEGQADGLAFSVPLGIRLPPSLLNIKKEIAQSLDRPSFCTHGSLEKWASQGVLLMNTTLTVLKGQANSHADLGWQRFTDKVIEIISKDLDNVVFILWGKEAEKKLPKINKNNHLILKSAHPSPLSASRGFFGCNHFKLANEYLQTHGKQPIDW